MTLMVKRFVLLLVCVTFVAATPGCAISKKDCLQNDWQTRGYTDGENGRSPDLISTYADTCAKYGVTPDPAAYTAGFDVGIKLYCTADKGLSEGERDQNYSGACPAELEKTFLKNYIAGLRLALDDLEIEYDRDSLELDRLRANRDRLATAGKPYVIDDERIKNTSSSLRSNSNKRSGINRKIRQWTSRL